MLAERIEELRTASNGADVLQAVENLRTELRPPDAPQPTRSDSPPTSRLSRQSAFDASVAALVERGLPTFASCFPFAKHGFTNPAQALNSADAFAYDAVAAEAAWRRAEEELERLL